MARRVIEAALCGLAVAAGAYLAEQLRDPYSDLRLGLSVLVDRVKGVTP